ARAAAGLVLLGTATAAATPAAAAPVGPAAAAPAAGTGFPDVGDWLRDIRRGDDPCTATTAWGDAHCPGRPLD
ncbi:hypothetical protein ACWGE1_34470, partial [Streptomyces sp. NPDC054932]